MTSSEILFFDTDEITENFFKKHAFGGRKSLFLPYDINDARTLSLKDLDKVEIISLFAHAQNVRNDVLDRFDSLLFAVPAVYYVMKLMGV